MDAIRPSSPARKLSTETPITSGGCKTVSKIREPCCTEQTHPNAAATLTRLTGFLATAFGFGSDSLDSPPVKPNNCASIDVSGDSLRLLLLLSGVEPRLRLGLRDGDLRLRCGRPRSEGRSSLRRRADEPFSSDCPLW